MGLPVYTGAGEHGASSVTGTNNEQHRALLTPRSFSTREFPIQTKETRIALVPVLPSPKQAGFKVKRNTQHYTEF